MAEEKEKFDKEKHQSAVLDLFRKAVEGVQLEDVAALEKLEGQERLDFLKFCSEVVSSPFFDQIFRSLYWPHILAGTTKAENYDIVTFHRATANGVSLVKEYFQKQARRYAEEFEKDRGSGFQSDKPFESVTEEDPDKFFKM